VATQVVAALIYQGGRLLACQRKATSSFPLKWEFPGGKVEEGEDPLPALKRELREELGIELGSAAEIFRHSHLYPHYGEVELIFFRVDDYQGRVANRAFEQLLWVATPELNRLDFLEGDQPLIEKLVSGELGY